MKFNTTNERIELELLRDTVNDLKDRINAICEYLEIEITVPVNFLKAVKKK